MYNFNKLPASWTWRAKKAGFTMEKMAKESGISKSHLSEVTRGKKNASLNITQRVERFLADNGDPFKLEYIFDE